MKISPQKIVLIISILLKWHLNRKNMSLCFKTNVPFLHWMSHKKKTLKGLPQNEMTPLCFIILIEDAPLRVDKLIQLFNHVPYPDKIFSRPHSK